VPVINSIENFVITRKLRDHINLRQSSMVLILLLQMGIISSRLCLGFTSGPMLPAKLQREVAFSFNADYLVPPSRPWMSTLHSIKTGEGELRDRKRGADGSHLSQSVLASCDNLPSYPTAHGLLCPETVERMEEEITQHGEHNPAVAKLLDRYHRYGPLSCVGMLSDPDILPHLTRALKTVL
jgi:hypothetical protein